VATAGTLDKALQCLVDSHGSGWGWVIRRAVTVVKFGSVDSR
jgi:hypothetical protein